MNHTMGEQLHYTYHGSEDLVYNLLTAFGKLQYTAHQLGLAHLQFELHAEPPTLYDLVYLAVDNIPGDQIWRKMRYDEMMSERRLYLYGDFVALKEHTEPYVLLVLTHHSGNAINWQNDKGRWIMTAPHLSAKLEAVNGR